MNSTNTTIDIFGKDVRIEPEEKEEKRFRYELFKHFIPDLTTKKENILEIDPDASVDFSPYIINKFYSMDSRDIFLANEMNRYPNTCKKGVYDFYIHGSAKRKRYNKWAKKPKNEEVVSFLMEQLNMSEQKAIIASEMIDTASIERIKEKLNKGGIMK